MGLLVLFASLLVQEPDVEDLLRKLETVAAESRDRVIDAVVAKGEKAEPEVRRRLEGASESYKSRLNLVLRRFELQRKLKELYPIPQPIDCDIRDKPVIEVIGDVEKWLGIPILRDKLPDATVTLKLEGVSPLQALDAFHAASGLTWRLEEDRRYDQERKIYIHELPQARLYPYQRSEWPAVISGRYRICALSTNLERSDFAKGPSKFGQVSVALQYPMTCFPEGLASFSVARIVDDKGRELALIPDPPRHPFLRMNTGGGRPSLTGNFRFAHPAADARSIALLGCRAKVEFVVERMYLTFERPEESVGATLECDGLKVKLKEFQPAFGWMRLILDQTGSLDISKVRVENYEFRGSSLLDRVEAVHEDGRITYPNIQGAQSEEGVYRKRMMSFGTPKVKAIRLAVRSFMAYEEIEFDLRGIPLPGAK